MNFLRPCAVVSWIAALVLATATTNVAFGQAKPSATVDRFGQSLQANYPEKVKDEAELKRDILSDTIYYGTLMPPTRDLYGGLPGSGEALGLQKTGFFHVEQKKDKWYLVPAGNVFYLLGICAIGTGDDYTKVKGNESAYTWLPEPDGELKTAYRTDTHEDFSFYVANRIRKYGKPFDSDTFVDGMLRRVHKWGFNSGGPFSSITDAYTRQNFTSTMILDSNLPDIPGIGGTFDPFDPENRSNLDKTYAARLPARANDPLLIGYFQTNEPAFEDIPRVLPRLGKTQACKREFAHYLEGKYKTLDAFNKAWGMQAKSFDEVAATPLNVTTASAIADVYTFTGQFLDAYYKLIADTVHKYDTHHMLLGNRFQSGSINNEQLCRVAGKYLDIMSFNYYCYNPDKDFLARLYKWTGRPMLFSEWYFASPDSSGLPGGTISVKTQEDRGLAYRHYVEQTASLGYVLGAQWFVLVDQSITGRYFDPSRGESSNAGLISVADRPWKTMLESAMKTNYEIYDVVMGKRPPFAYDAPLFNTQSGGSKTINIPRAMGKVAMDGTLKGFPGIPAEQIAGQRLVLGADAGGLQASFKMCADDTNLYLLFNVADPTPMKNNYKGDMIWSADAIELFIGVDHPEQDGPLLPSDRQVLLSAGKVDGAFQSLIKINQGQSTQRQNGVKLVVVPNVDGKGYVMEVAIPFDHLGITPQSNQEIRFDVAIDDSYEGTRRERQLVWNGNERNSRDRSPWGRAKFLR